MSSNYKIVCYYTNWSWYRTGDGKYGPDNIDPALCTHLIYSFAVLDESSLTIKSHDPDLDQDFYKKVTNLKSRGIKVLIAIGGWTDSAGSKYSRLVNNPAARQRFINSVIHFLSLHNFDGLDLDWEYPKNWQGQPSGPDSDKPAFASFVRELSEAFRPRGLLLSAAVSPSKGIIDSAYDVPMISQYLDFINVMAYDYHGQWEHQTGHHSPLYQYPGDVEPAFNINFTINHWLQLGADPKKLILGIPTYGRSFTLVNRPEHGLNAPANGGGAAGESTNAAGMLSYYEISKNILQRGWNVVTDSQQRIGPYAYSHNQWVGYDNHESIITKTNYIKSMGLGGAMVWTLDFDDFKRLYSNETYPLLRTINRGLKN